MHRCSEALTRARLEGQRVFGEVLAQHLVINDGVYRDKLATYHHVMSPPFRAPEHREACGVVSNRYASNRQPIIVVFVPRRRRWVRMTFDRYLTVRRC